MDKRALFLIGILLSILLLSSLVFAGNAFNCHFYRNNNSGKAHNRCSYHNTEKVQHCPYMISDTTIRRDNLQDTVPAYQCRCCWSSQRKTVTKK